MLEAEVVRVKREIGRIGRPAGMTSAIVILAIYSALGIVALAVVMGLGLDTLGCLAGVVARKPLRARPVGCPGLHLLVRRDPERSILSCPSRQTRVDRHHQSQHAPITRAQRVATGM